MTLADRIVALLDTNDTVIFTVEDVVGGLRGVAAAGEVKAVLEQLRSAGMIDRPLPFGYSTLKPK